MSRCVLLGMAVATSVAAAAAGMLLTPLVARALDHVYADGGYAKSVYTNNIICGERTSSGYAAITGEHHGSAPG